MKQSEKKAWIQTMYLGELIPLLIGTGISVLGYSVENFNVFLTGMLVIFINNIVWAVKRKENRCIFLIFHITLFTFCLGRPLIGMFTGEEWWNYASQAKENIWFALILLITSLIAMQLGVIAVEQTHKFVIKARGKKVVEQNRVFVHNLQFVALCMYILTMIFFLAQEIEPLIVIKPGHYLEYYSSFQSRIPDVFHTIASFMKYSLCIFLATLPSKKKAFIPLAIFELSAVPSLILGVRNPIMLNSVFILVYYLLRDILKDEKKWIGKLEKWFVGIMTPLVLIFMGLYSFIREGNGIQAENPFGLFLDFFKGQGVTFDAMSIAYGYRAGIKSLEPKNYTFGGFIDYILHGNIGQKLFGTSPLPSGNNEINGLYSNNFSHNFSYISFKKDYLEGRGRGSSYILENYFDFGYIGVIIFSLILGAVMVAVVYWFGKKVLASTIILVSLTTFFLIPRAEATGWLTFIITAQFWVCIAACYLGAYICTKSTFIRRILSKLHIYTACEN